MIALLESVKGDYGQEYRITYRRYYRSLDKVKADLLNHIPPSEKQSVLDQLPKS